MKCVCVKGNLFCVNREDGNILWSREFSKDFQGIYPLHGHSEAAVIKDDNVFWTPGGETLNVVALNRHSGEVIWSHPGFSERSGYNPGQLISHNGRDIFITFTAYHLLGFDADSGELLWSEEQFGVSPDERKLGLGDTHANSVIYADGAIFYAAGDGNRGVRLDLSEDGSEVTESWRNEQTNVPSSAISGNPARWSKMRMLWFLYTGTKSITKRKTIQPKELRRSSSANSATVPSGPCA